MGRWADYAKGSITRLLTRAESALRPPPVDNSSSAIPGLPLYDQFLRIGGNITPEQVSAIYRNADVGYTWQLCDLGNESRQKDGHLQGVLEQRENALGPLLVQVDPFVEPGAKKPTAQDVKIAEALHKALKEAKGGNAVGGLQPYGFNRLKKHLQSGNWFGYAMAETIWDKNAEGLLVPTGWFCHSPRRFGFRLEDGALVQWDQVGSKANWHPKVEVQQWQPMRWVQHQPRITGDVPAREGYGRVLIWSSIFGNWTISDLLKLAELTWKPYRVGTYHGTISDKDRAALLFSLQQLTNNGICVKSDRSDIDFKWPEKGQSSSSNHISLLEFLNAEKSKIVLHGTLTMEAGQRGARSLGQVHERGFDAVVEDDSCNSSDTLQRDVAVPFVRLNYGDNAGVPTVTLVTSDQADLSVFAVGLKTIVVDAGMRVPEKWAYDRIGCPIPEEDERCVGDPTEEELAAEEEAKAEAEKAAKEAAKAAEKAGQPPPGEQPAAVPGQQPPALAQAQAQGQQAPAPPKMPAPGTVGKTKPGKPVAEAKPPKGKKPPA